MFDIIIIGSGLGGLVSGYILSKHGFNVCVLEQCAQVGGCLQTFRRFGEKFDTGMHYIGSMDEGQVLHRLFRYLDLLPGLELQRLDEEAFDIIDMAGTKYKYAMGHDRFVATLSEQFPHHHEDILRYDRLIQDIAARSPLYNMHKIDTQHFIDVDDVKRSVNESIAALTDNDLLQQVLAGNSPLYAGVKDKTPIYIHALISNFYIQSAYRIVGGSDAIAASLVRSIRAHGGQVRTSARVEKIECDDQRATAVTLASGERLEARSFISNIHPQTMLHLLDTKLLRKAYRERVNGLENTTANFTLYLKFKAGTVPYLNYNYYFYEHPDVWRPVQPQQAGYPDSYLFMHQCHEPNPRYARSAEMIAYMGWDEVTRWENTRVGRRGEDYLEFKERKAQQMIERLNQSFPGIAANIEAYETSSPLTYRDYTGTHQGSMYGILRDKNFPTQTLVSQRTKVPNLYLTGQNINSHGVLGVSIGALITSAEFLGLNTIIEEIEKI